MSVTGRAIVCNGNYCLFVFCSCSVLPLIPSCLYGYDLHQHLRVGKLFAVYL